MLPWYCNINASLVLQSSANAAMLRPHYKKKIYFSMLKLGLIWHIWQRYWFRKHNDSLTTDIAKSLSWYTVIPLILGMRIQICYLPDDFIPGRLYRQKSKCMHRW